MGQEWTLGKWYQAVVGAVIIIGANLLVIGLVNDLRFEIPAIGIITFFGVLTLSNVLSRSSALEKGEVRKALAVSIIFVYFSLLGITFSGRLADTEVGTTVIGHFTTLVGVIIAFYFGSRAVESWAKLRSTVQTPQLEVTNDPKRAREHEHWNFPPGVVDKPGEHGLPKDAHKHPEKVNLESICGGIDTSKPVEQYKGLLGVTMAFVDEHQAPVGQIQ